MREQLENMKSDLKLDAVELRLKKESMKQEMRNGNYSVYSTLQNEILRDKYDIRHKHIAYCFCLGTDYEMIEPKCGADNKADHSKVERYLEEYGIEIKEGLLKW
jgi:hypothetical protein